jgi:hypothetical protein
MWKTLKFLTDTEVKNQENIFKDIIFQYKSEKSISDKYNNFLIESIKDIEASIISNNNYNVSKTIKIDDIKGL